MTAISTSTKCDALVVGLLEGNRVHAAVSTFFS